MKLEKAIEIMKENREILGTQGQSGRFTENANTIACKIAIEAIENQVMRKGKEITWEVLIKSISRNAYEVEQEILDHSDRSVAMDEMIPVVNQGFILGLLYSISEGNTIILPPK